MTYSAALFSADLPSLLHFSFRYRGYHHFAFMTKQSLNINQFVYIDTWYAQLDSNTPYTLALHGPSKLSFMLQLRGVTLFA